MEGHPIVNKIRQLFISVSTVLLNLPDIHYILTQNNIFSNYVYIFPSQFVESRFSIYKYISIY